MRGNAERNVSEKQEISIRLSKYYEKRQFFQLFMKRLNELGSTRHQYNNYPGPYLVISNYAK
jgi:hypothetical protein